MTRVAEAGIRGIPANFGGSETAVEEIGRRLVGQGYELIVYCRRNNSTTDAAEYLGMRRVVLPSFGGFNFDTITHSFLASLHVLLRNTADVIHFHGVGNALLLPLFVASRKRVVVTIDGPDWERPKWGRFARLMLKLGARMAVRWADNVIIDNQPTIHYFKEHWGVEGTYIAYGADRDPPTGTAYVESLGLRPNGYVLFVGALVPDKGPDVLINSYRRVNTTMPLVLVGDSPFAGGYRESLRAVAASDERVRMLGYVYGDRYRELLANAYCYVHPLRADGTSPALLQAMGYGKCIVVNSLPEALSAVGDTAWAYATNDSADLARKLQQVLSDPELTARLGERAGRRAAEQYDWDEVATAHGAVYSKVTEPSRSRKRPWITMLLENNPYPQDVRVRAEAESLVSAGYRVTVVAPRHIDQPKQELIRGVEVRRFRLQVATRGAVALFREFLVASLTLYLAALRALALGADVLHLHNPPDTLFPAGWVARLLGRRVVFDHHDLTPELVASRTPARRTVSFARWCERQTFRVASLVLASNASYAQVARSRGGRRPDDVVVVRNAPRTATLATRTEIRPGALSDPHLVYVGDVAPQDHAEDLPLVLAQLRDRHGIPAARLTIVGDGSACDAVVAQARREGVADRITITGWLDSEEVPRIIRDADVCVDPARPTPLNDASTMVKIAEYLAAARPVVAYDLTETRRTAGDAACLVSGDDPALLAEGVAALALDEELRRTTAERARHRAAELTWEQSERILLRAYAKLLDGRVRRPAPSLSG